ncbi:MAG: hypothetical protein AAB606_01600, partial [Patescibacteria group bacterium]
AKSKYVKQLNSDWIFADPGMHIINNFPLLKDFQLLEYPVTFNEFRMGEAAQACCYGVNNPAFRIQNESRKERIVRTYGGDVVRPVKNLPRSTNEGIGFDVPLIAAIQADKAGVQEIEVESLCTSCHGLASDVMGEADKFGTWYSNLRENPETTKTKGYGMRNAVVVYPK